MFATNVINVNNLNLTSLERLISHVFTLNPGSRRSFRCSRTAPLVHWEGAHQWYSAILHQCARNQDARSSRDSSERHLAYSALPRSMLPDSEHQTALASSPQFRLD